MKVILETLHAHQIRYVFVTPISMFCVSIWKPRNFALLNLPPQKHYIDDKTHV